ncbi:hypothetical protein AB0K02_23945 [Streptomyces sp. NPDC049597]|uniref:hypothetical protein n=1 Tax=Streptomyces sp. NPDC049597 TaxID=3155276 RepID=UPI003442E2B8
MTDEWAETKRNYPVGSQLTGTVARVAPFGIFVSVQGARPSGVVADLAGMHKDAADDSVVLWPRVGDSITGVVVEHSEHNEELKIHLT